MHHLIIFSLLLTLLGCTQGSSDWYTADTRVTITQTDTFPIASSVRALQVLDDEQLWFAGSEGIWGRTQDGGQSWTIDSIRLDTLIPHFRSISVTNSAVHLLSIGSPALLFRSTDQGANWEVAYKEEHPKAFYDAMAFWDEQFGIAMGDPTESCLSVIRTEDGGRSWTKVDCAQIPEAAEGEAAFAASNTNITLGENGKAWMVSGGTRARVYTSDDYGRSWTVVNSPISEGGQMTGIYSVDFFDAQTGVIFGGDWNQKDQNTKNKAISTDGGKSWQLLSDGKEPGYRSCVRFIPGSKGQGILAAGIPGISISLDQGVNWQELSTDSYYTFGFGADHKTIWLAGSRKLTRLELDYQK